MGLQFPTTIVKDKIVLDIPEEHIPLFKPVEIPEKIMILGNTYIYGGGGLTRVDDVIIPRTGIWGPLPIPIYPRLTHYRTKGARKWTYIPEEPVLTAGYWRSGIWRANIPKSIRIKYQILPYNEVHLVYTEKIPTWVVNIFHLGTWYTARWYPREKVARWEIPKESLCYESLRVAFETGNVVNGDCHIERDVITVDLVFSGFGGKHVSNRTGRCYRYMVVRNFNLEIEDEDYPVNAELRTSYITTCPREYYQSEENYLRLVDALEITVRNVQAWFLYSFHKSLKPKKDIRPVVDKFDEKGVMYGKRELKRGGRMKVTKGYTEPQELHPSLVRYDPFYQCIKYCRIKLPHWEHEYTNDEIKSKLMSRLKKLEMEGKITPNLIYFDNEGFLWMRL